MIYSCFATQSRRLLHALIVVIDGTHLLLRRGGNSIVAHNPGPRLRIYAAPETAAYANHDTPRLCPHRSAALAAPSLSHAAAFAAPRSTPAPPPDEVLRLLKEGNARFAAGTITHPARTPNDFKPLAEGQASIAAIVGCADSRVPPEILFDLGVGDLFVIRVAGNYISGAGASVKGSIEYAVAELGVSLILGQSQNTDNRAR